MPKKTVQPLRTGLLNGANIKIEWVRNDALREEVCITNEGTLAQPMSFWALASLFGERFFFFPEDLFLLPGKSVFVHSGQNQSGTVLSDDIHLVWTDEQVWNNRGDLAVLFDAHGEEVDRFGYPREQVRSRNKDRRKILSHDGDKWTIKDEPVNNKRAGLRLNQRGMP
jgi:hypothetical protein